MQSDLYRVSARPFIATLFLVFLSLCFRTVRAEKTEYDLKSVFSELKNYIEEIGPSGRPSAVFFNDTHYKNVCRRILNKLTRLPLSSYEQLTHEVRLAFWINLHNLYVIKVISDHYPVKSNRYISAPLKKLFDLPELEIFNKRRTINQIRNEILKKEFKDPRIPFCLYMGAKDGPQVHFFSLENQSYDLGEAVHVYVRDNCMINSKRKFIILTQLIEWWLEEWTAAPLPKQYFDPKIMTTNRAPGEKIILSFLNKYIQYDTPNYILLTDPKIKIRFKRFNWSVGG